MKEVSCLNSLCADIFSDNEEAELTDKISRLSSKVAKDIVVVTDVSDYGLGHEKYCYDFYDFNGYGIGKEFEGVCIFVCMDPNNRGWWTGVTGDVSRSLYSEKIANEIDDALYAYMVNGNYADGISDWVDRIYLLYSKGNPSAPEWYPETYKKDDYVREHNADAPRVYESLNGEGTLSSEEERVLTEKAKKISDKYGVDVVIHITWSDAGLGFEQYIDDYYYYNGYGLGEDYNAIVFCIFDGPKKTTINTFGRIKNELSEANYKRMLEQSDDEIYYYAAVDVFLDNLEHWERTGRVSRTFRQWIFAAVAASLVGLFFGKKSLNKAEKNMITVRSSYSADNYVTSASDFSDGTETFVSRNVQKTYIPPKSSYSGSSSSRSSSSRSRSTYHSSSRGSSGRSHSGSGRRF